jgi:hypothetical protein
LSKYICFTNLKHLIFINGGSSIYTESHQSLLGNVDDVEVNPKDPHPREEGDTGLIKRNKPTSTRLLAMPREQGRGEKYGDIIASPLATIDQNLTYNQP